MAIIFDGRDFAAKKEEVLKGRVFGLKTRGVYPKLASIIVGDDPASKLYVGLKQKAAKRIGAEMDIYYLPEKVKLEDVILLIGTLNTDDTVQGIMIQMPLPEKLNDHRDQLVNLINPEKDVDGLQKDSQFLHPTSKAVIDILIEAEKQLEVKMKTVCVVGATGMVGKPLVSELKVEGYKVTECNSKTKDLQGATKEVDVVISCTGIPGIINGDMVKDDSIIIDVGSPKGDVSLVASDKSAFYTPVPGGVGPVTISCLLENLISAC